MWRRKADLEAAIEALPTTLATSAPQNAPGRASADLEDAKTLAGVVAPAKTETTKRAIVTAPPRPSSSSKTANRGKSGKGHGSGKGRAAGKRVLGRGAGALGAAAATVLLAASSGSSAMTGARGLQLAMIKDAFARLDLDGDGFITPGDLGLAFRNMGRDASDRRWVVAIFRVRRSTVPWHTGCLICLYTIAETHC